jgi:chromosome segregation ATPase
MLDWLGLDRTKALRETISAYEVEIEVERSRAESLRERLARTRDAGTKLENQGLDLQTHPAGLVAQELQHRIETTNKQIDRMAELVAHFRGELVGLEGRKSQAFQS